LSVERWTFAFRLKNLQNSRAFHRHLLSWYRRRGRDLPWRHTRDPYAVLVSEVMLQQTQVAAVLPRYRQWMERFPDFQTLADASQNDVLHAWQGLGYYTRARNLHATAKLLTKRPAGNFPASTDELRRLPGIGRYTAHAVACFALNQAVPIVEANTARVLARLFDLQISADTGPGRQALWDRAAALMPGRSVHDYNSALIDLGALICLPQPKCRVCPVKRFCSATNPESQPLRKRRVAVTRLVENHVFVLQRNKILLQQTDRRWRGMWILPPLHDRWNAKLDRFNRSRFQRGPIYTAVFAFTHHRVTLRVFARQPPEIGDRFQRWFPVHRLDSIPVPSPHRRAISTLLDSAFRRRENSSQRRGSPASPEHTRSTTRRGGLFPAGG
jgi:A/G-specific adenine glycosylase